MVLGMHQHQADLHFPFALVAFDKLGLHAMRLAQRLARLLHHRFRCGKVALLRLLQRGIGQAAGLSADQDRLWLSAGTTYAFNKDASVDVGVSYMHGQHVEIKEGPYTFRSEGTAWLYGANFNYRF